MQNGVLRAVESCKTRFYLTGGTALSRAYYRHRYSEDLDFFVNGDPDYDEAVDLVLAKLREEGFFWDPVKDFVKAPAFRTLKVSRGDCEAVLKLDFVNDSTPHFGEFTVAAFFSRIDPVRNILSNKLGAVFRLAGKDVADIREIALHESVDWTALINEARQKDSGIDLPYVAEVLRTIPRHEFEGIHWITSVSWETFKADLEQIAFAMLKG